MKKFFSLLTTLVMMVSLVGVVPSMTAGASGGVQTKVNELVSKYNGYKSSFVYGGASGCLGFAKIASEYVFGVTYYRDNQNGAFTKITTSSSFSTLCSNAKVGDIINRSDNGHTAMITSVSSSSMTLIEYRSSQGGTTVDSFTSSTWSSWGFSSYSWQICHANNYTSIDNGGTVTWGNNYMNLGSDFYAYIINSKCWKHLTNDGDNVSIRTETGAANQVWHFKYQSDGYYKIYNCKDGKALDVNGASSASGTNVKVYTDHTTDAQLWRMYYNNGTYFLKAKCSDCALDVNNGYSTDGTNVQMWTKNNTDAQIFSIYKLNTPGKSTIGYNAKCSTVKFTWSKTSDTKHYNLRIFKGNTDYKSLWNLTTTSATVELPAGTYRVYVDSCNNYSYTKSNEFTFTITKEHNHTSKITKSATCTNDGVKTYTCSSCDDTYTETIKATGHKYLNGTCTVCGAKDSNYKEPVKSTTTRVDKNAKTTQSTTKPSAQPSTTAAKTISVAQAKSATQKAMKQAKITKLKAKSKAKKKITVSWKRVSKAKGYQVQVAAKNTFKKSKIVLSKLTAKKKLTIKSKKLKSGKTYYIRVRAYATYKDSNGKTQKVYSKWIKKIRKVTVK